MIVVKVRDRRRQRVHVGGSRLRDTLRLVCLFAGRERLLVGGIGLGFHVRDALLGAFVGVLDVAGVLGRQVVELVRLINDGGRLFLDVVFCGATGAEENAGAGE